MPSTPAGSVKDRVCVYDSPVPRGGALLWMALRRRGARLGVASLCVGGGQGAAVLLENPEGSHD